MKRKEEDEEEKERKKRRQNIVRYYTDTMCSHLIDMALSVDAVVWMCDVFIRHTTMCIVCVSVCK